MIRKMGTLGLLIVGVAACQTVELPPPNSDLYDSDYGLKPQGMILRCMQVAKQTPQLTGGDESGEFAEMLSYWAERLELQVEDELERTRLSDAYAAELPTEKVDELFSPNDTEMQNYVLALGLAKGRCDEIRAGTRNL